MLAKFPSTVARFSRMVFCTYEGKRFLSDPGTHLEEEHSEEILFREEKK
jgi:hypothetical protein